MRRSGIHSFMHTVVSGTASLKLLVPAYVPVPLGY